MICNRPRTSSTVVAQFDLDAEPGNTLSPERVARARTRFALVDTLLTLPWQVSAILAVVVPAVFLVVSLVLSASGLRIASLSGVARLFAGVSGVCFALLAGGAAIHAARKRRLAGAVRDDPLSRDVSSKEFEWAIGELFAQHGFKVKEQLAPGPDGGIDVRAWRDGELFVVQCKQWRTRAVGVATVRELLGIVVAERARGGILFSAGSFTPDAVHFARGQPIQLINGSQLRSRRKRAAPPSATAPAACNTATDAPRCPQCGATMVHRIARRGANAGSAFWGCSGYPSCKGTRTSENAAQEC